MDFLINARMLGRIYQNCFSKALKISKRYWWVSISLLIYFFIERLVGKFVLPFGPWVGGLILALVRDACVSSFLVMVEAMIREERILLNDFKRSFWVYFWDVIGVFFLFFIVELLVIAPLGQAGLVWAVLGIYFAFLILFNPIPELIYNERHGTIELYQRAYGFIVANWIEWFVPNLLIMGVYGFVVFFLMEYFPIRNLLLFYAVWGSFSALYVYFFMIFRGLLFKELHRSSRRMRIFQYRATESSPK